MSTIVPAEKSPCETDTIKYDFKVIYNHRFKLWDYGWCNIICSQVPGLSGGSFIPADFFATLLNHEIHRQDYGSMRSEETGDIHGPFLIERLKPSDFVEISVDEQIEYMQARHTDSEHFYEPAKAA